MQGYIVACECGRILRHQLGVCPLFPAALRGEEDPAPCTCLVHTCAPEGVHAEAWR